MCLVLIIFTEGVSANFYILSSDLEIFLTSCFPADCSFDLLVLVLRILSACTE